MTTLKTRPYTGGIALHETHTLALPPCCPVSHNPYAGSTITIQYDPKTHVLDVLTLPGYIRSYSGGKRDDTGAIEVRDMEAMIARIASDCATLVGVAVTVTAHLFLKPEQRMDVTVTCS